MIVGWSGLDRHDRHDRQLIAERDSCQEPKTSNAAAEPSSAHLCKEPHATCTTNFHSSTNTPILHTFGAGAFANRHCFGKLYTCSTVILPRGDWQPIVIPSSVTKPRRSGPASFADRPTYLSEELYRTARVDSICHILRAKCASQQWRPSGSWATSTRRPRKTTSLILPMS